MQPDSEKSLSDEATFAGRPRPQRADVSLGDERTLGDAPSGQDTIIDDIEVVDLEARYRIDGTLGQGGMGAVLLATDTRLDRKVAIKRILGEAAGNRMAVNRFLTEAKSIAALNHPNIVQIYDYGRAKDGPFLIMEFVDGGSLLDSCRDGAMPLESAVDLACQLCDGLAKAHDLGIIHRDIKPANVLLTKDGTPKLTDFGLAKAQTGDHGQTMTGAVLGTPDFMSPEQRRDAALVDHRSDVWSLAATVYQMVTGRSPKIIRFDLLPAELTKVLGKALEDAKDHRYQTVREFRDALKVSLKAAAPQPFATAEGQCPSCGVQNDSSRRFCRGCGGSLEAPCLSCDKPMPIGEEICGSCGAKQTPLLEVRRAEMAAAQAKAEGLLGDFRFDEASRIATTLREEPNARLSHLKQWAEGFLQEVEKSRSHQVEQAAASLGEAAKHEEAFDYLSAIFTLESVPNAMRSVAMPGARETVTAVLDRLKRKQAESRRLESLLKERIASKSVDGLLPEVEQFLKLHPDRRDVQKLRQQLLDRQKRQETTRGEAVTTAKMLMARHEYEAAVAAIANVSAAALTPEVSSLRSELEDLVGRVRGLAETIRAAVAVKQLDGLLGLVDEYLKLKPGDTEVSKLRQSIIAREEKLATELAARRNQATSLFRSGQFAEAADVLEAIPEARRSEWVRQFVVRCQRAAILRAEALQALLTATAGKYAEAIAATAGYQKVLEEPGVADDEFTELLSNTEAAYAKEHRSRRLLRTGGLVAASAAAVVALVCGGLWIRSSQRAASVAEAVRTSRWEDALSLAPDNADALVGRARAKLVAKPADIDGAFADIERAEKGTPGLAAVKTARGTAHAARAADHARSDHLAEAAQEMEEAVGLNADPQSLAVARNAITTAWLARAEEAVAKRDGSLVRSACDAAAKAGASVEAINQLRAKAMIADAVAMFGRGESEKAVVVAIKGIEANGSVCTGILQSAGYTELREAVVKEYRKRFDSFVAADAWREAIQLSTTAERLDSQASGWLPPDLPPAALAALPTLRNSIGIELRMIPAGTFTMGSESLGDNYTPHKVTLTNSFYIGVHEVTNAQWEQVMGRNVHSREASSGQPVTGVNWEDAIEFCRRLSMHSAEQAAGRTYRLPTEAEWEYACRAGTTTQYSFGDNDSELVTFGWFDGNSGGQAHPVGQKKPNDWGLYDMHGNVLEWCNDWFVAYSKGATTNPGGPAAGPGRTARGGNYMHKSDVCGSAHRNWFLMSYRYSGLGFRVALSLPRAASPSAEKTAEARLQKSQVKPGDGAAGSDRGEGQDRLRNSIDIELQLIPAGTFTMGDARGEADERPHKVTLTRPFYIGVHEVTNSQWQKLMGDVPSKWKDADHPVEQISWDDAVGFCRQLSERPQEKAAGRVYRLPTEAEWEYACRAGATTRYSFGDDVSQLGDFCWFRGNSGLQSHPAGQKKPNAWGLHDMHGNVWEWCSDWYGPYPGESVTDPIGASKGSLRVLRGGRWYDDPIFCRSAYRLKGDQSPRDDGGYVGLRLAMSSSGSGSPDARSRTSSNNSSASDDVNRRAPGGTEATTQADGEVADRQSGMVCPGLGTKCNYNYGDWSGKWVRRGNSNIFDCTMFHGPARETCTYVASLEVNGESVIVRRTQVKSTIYGVAPAGAVDEYIWHLGKDGKTLYDKKDPTYTILERAK